MGGSSESTQAVRDYHVHPRTAGISRRRSIKERLQGSGDDEPTKRRTGKEIMDGSSKLSTEGEEHRLTGTGPTEPSFVQSGKAGTGTGAGDRPTSSVTIQAKKNLQLGFGNLDVGSTQAVRDYHGRVSTAGTCKRRSIRERLYGSEDDEP
jgi:hypothetical protein